MRCPFCGHDDTQVKDSRASEDGISVRRRRFCTICKGRFTTFERVQLRELTVIKKNGQRRPFDRDKLSRSISMALRKRQFSPEQIELLVTSVVSKLESLGDHEVTTHQIGELVMNKLAQIDQVAYVRFASVYKDFNAPRDFQHFIEQLGQTRVKQDS